MKSRDLKALARETLLKWYGSAVLARFFRGILVGLSLALSCAFLILGLINAKAFPTFPWDIFPGLRPSAPLAVVFFMLFFIGLVFTIILGVWLTFGYERMLLNICRGKRASSGDVLSAFRSEARPWKVLWVCIVRVVLILAPMLIPLFVYGCAVVCGYDSVTAAWYDPWRISIRTLQILTVMWMFYLSLGFCFADTVIIDRPETGVVEALRISLKKVTGGRKPRLFWLGTFSFLFWALLVEIVPFAALWVNPYIETTMILYYLDGLGELEQLPAYAELLKKQKEEEELKESVALETLPEEPAVNTIEEKPAEEQPAESAAEAQPATEAPGEQPAEPAQPAAEAPAEQPAEPAQPAAETPAEQPAEQAQPAAEAPAEQPAEQPAEAAPAPVPEEESGKEMEAIPRKLVFPDIEAEPGNEPDANRTEE